MRKQKPSEISGIPTKDMCCFCDQSLRRKQKSVVTDGPFIYTEWLLSKMLPGHRMLGYSLGHLPLLLLYIFL